MTNTRFKVLLMLICLVLGSPKASAVQKINTDMVDGIKVQSPTRVVAGKYFQVKLTSNRGKIDGVCYMYWENSNGFAIPRDFKMTRGVASVKVLPVKPGPGQMSFYCGKTRSDSEIGGSRTIYIAP